MSIPAIVLVGAEHPDELQAAFARYTQEYDVRLVRSCREALETTHEVIAGAGTVAMFVSESVVPDADTVLHAVHQLREKVPTARRVIAAHWDRFLADAPELRSGLATGKYDAFLLMPRGVRDEEFHHAITDLLSDWGSTVPDPEVVAVKIVSPERDVLTLAIRDFLDRMGMPSRVYPPDSDGGCCSARSRTASGFRARSPATRAGSCSPVATCPSSTGETGYRPAELATTVPGIFCAGDVRVGSMKRVASASGEGASVVPLVHAFLAPEPD